MKNLLYSPANVNDGLVSIAEMHKEAETEMGSEDSLKNNSASLKNILEEPREEKQSKYEPQKQQETQPESGPTSLADPPAVKFSKSNSYSC